MDYQNRRNKELTAHIADEQNSVFDLSEIVIVDDSQVWEEPIPLSDLMDIDAKFPVDALPKVLTDIALAISVSTSTDVAMVGTALISALSYCFTGVYRIQGKQDHTEPLLVNSLVVAEPSSKKSPVFASIKKPFTDFERNWNKTHELEINRAKAERELKQQKLTKLLNKCTSSPEEIATLRTELSNMRGCNKRRIFIDDATPESLGCALEQNKTLLMFSAESGALDNFCGRYSNKSNLDLLLKSWNGETYVVDRITRAAVELKNPYISICLACQPDFFESLICNRDLLGRGFIARLVFCFPKSNIGSRTYDTPSVPQNVVDKYADLVNKLLAVKFNYEAEDELVLNLDDDAYRAFVDYNDSFIEKQLLTDMNVCRDWGGKYHGLILRLCGIIHCVRCALEDVNVISTRVSLDTFNCAKQIGEYYRETAIYAYFKKDEEITNKKAKRVLDRISEIVFTEGTQNDLYRICRCKLFRNADDFDKTIQLLETNGYLRRKEAPGANGNNKSKCIVEVNPKFNM